MSSSQTLLFKKYFTNAKRLEPH